MFVEPLKLPQSITLLRKLDPIAKTIAAGESIGHPCGLRDHPGQDPKKHDGWHAF
jgi:hypothetical protein